MTDAPQKALSLAERNAGLVLVSAFAVLYLATMSPGVMTDDSAEFQHLCTTLGKTHPPGYPLLLIVGKLFSALPLGVVSWRITLISVASAVAAVYLLYLLLLRLQFGIAISMAVSAAVALSHTFWMQSVLPEAYALNVVFLLGLLLAAMNVRAGGERGNRWAFIMLFLMALGAGNHQTLVFLFPVFAMWIWGYRKKCNWRMADYPLAAIFFLAGLTIFLVLPFRFMNLPEAAEQRGAWAEALYWISGGPSQDLFIGFKPLEILKRFVTYLGYHSYQFPIIGALLGIVGVLFFWMRDRGLFLLMSAIWAITVGYALVFLSSDVYVFYLPGYVVFSVFIAFGIQGAYQSLRSRIWRIDWLKRGRIAALAGIVILPPVVYALTPGLLDRNGIVLSEDKGNRYYLSPWKGSFHFFENAGRHFLLSAELRETVFTDWNYFHTLRYLQEVERVRTDVNILNELESRRSASEWFVLANSNDASERQSFLATRRPLIEGEAPLFQVVGAGYRIFPEHYNRSKESSGLARGAAVGPKAVILAGSEISAAYKKAAKETDVEFDLKKQDLTFRGQFAFSDDTHARGQRLQVFWRAIMPAPSFTSSAFSLDARDEESGKIFLFNRPFHANGGKPRFWQPLSEEDDARKMQIDTWIPADWPPGRYTLYIRLGKQIAPDKDEWQCLIWRLGEIEVR